MASLLCVVALGLAAVAAKRLCAAARALLRREAKNVLGHTVRLPAPVTAAQADAFAPLGEWMARADRFFADGDRRLLSLAIVDPVVSGEDVLQLTLRCRAALTQKTESVDVVLRYPAVVLALWRRDDTHGIELLVVKQDQLGMLRSGVTLPHGRNVRGDFRGGCLQQVRLDTGLTVKDAQRVADLSVETNPRLTNERCEFYSGELPNLRDLLDQDDEGQTCLVPLREYMDSADPWMVSVLFRATRVFAGDDEGYRTP